jgi:hypothetical protein
MDSVIRVTVITILYGIDKSGDSEQWKKKMYFIM